MTQKKKFLLWGLGLCCGAFTARAQVFYNNGSTIFINSGAIVKVNGNLVNNTGTLTNNGTLITIGNITNNATMPIPANGVLQLNGAAAQTLGGSSPIVAKAVTINNTSGVTLSTPLRIDGAASFTNGLMNATNSSYPVVFTANGSVSGTPTNASHVNGYVVKEGTGAFTFPLGNATNYQPVGVNLTVNSGGLTALYVPADAGTGVYSTRGTEATPLVQYNTNEYWDLSPIGTATGSITINYDTYRSPALSNNTADLRVAHKATGQWLNEGRAAGSTGNNVSGSIISNAVSNWSPFTFGAISAVILPVRLTAFTGTKQGTSSLLTWQVAGEESISTYTIERSADGRRFITVGSVASLGNTTAPRSYSFTDISPVAGANYYRIRTIEKDGKVSCSDIRLLNWGNTVSIAFYPNPVKDKATLTGVEAGMSIRLLDAVGKVLRVQQAAGTTENIMLGSFSKGLYSIQVYAVDGKLLNTTQVVKE